MKISLLLLGSLLLGSSAVYLWVGRAPETRLVDASGRPLTAGSAETAATAGAFEAGAATSVPPASTGPVGEGVEAAAEGASAVAGAVDPFPAVEAMLRRRAFGEAKERLLELIETDARDGLSCVLLCEATRQLGELDEAVDYGLKATELLPDHPRAHLAYAQAIGAQLMAEIDTVMGILKAKPRLDRFLAELDRVIELDPEDTQARTLLAMYHMAPAPIGDLDRALEVCREIEVRDPVAGRRWQAVIHHRKGELDRAIELCLSGIEDFPPAREYQLTLAGVYADQGRFDEAQLAYEASRAGARDEVYYCALHDHARMLVEAKLEPEVAIGLLEEFIEARPTGDFVPSLGRAWWRKGMALEHAGRSQEARSAYERCLALEPGFEPAREARDRLPSAR